MDFRKKFSNFSTLSHWSFSYNFCDCYNCSNVKWLTLASLTLSLLNFVAALVLLGGAFGDFLCNWIYKDSFPLKSDAEWRDLILLLVPFAIGLLACSAIFINASSRRGKPGVAFTVLLLHAILIGMCCIQLHYAYKIEVTAGEDTGNDAKGKMLQVFGERARKHPKRRDNWTPAWLDDYQANHKCCGIQGFQDWESFWWLCRGDEIPMACCKSIPCPWQEFSLAHPRQINPFVFESGCFESMRSQVLSKVGVMQKMLVTVLVLLVLGLLSFIVQSGKDLLVQNHKWNNSRPDSKERPGSSEGLDTWERLGFVDAQSSETEQLENKKGRNDDDLDADINFEAGAGSYSNVVLSRLEGSANASDESVNSAATDMSHDAQGRNQREETMKKWYKPYWKVVRSKIGGK